MNDIFMLYLCLYYIALYDFYLEAKLGTSTSPASDTSGRQARSLCASAEVRENSANYRHKPWPPRPPNVAPLRALGSLLDSIWGVLKGSGGVLVIVAAVFTFFWLYLHCAVVLT